MITPRQAEPRELSLVRAVLRQAIVDFTLPPMADTARKDKRQCEYYRRARERMREQIREWFQDEDTDTSYSFGWCCDQLGLNPELARRKILALTPRKYGDTGRHVVERYWLTGRG